MNTFAASEHTLKFACYFAAFPHNFTRQTGTVKQIFFTAWACMCLRVGKVAKNIYTCDASRVEIVFIGQILSSSLIGF